MARQQAPATNTEHTRRWNIEVTADDIERAQVDDSYRCVVAQAVARTIPDATRIEVDVQTVRFTRSGERLIYLTPYSVAGYVVAFDAGDEIHPFRFQLRDPIKGRRRQRTSAGQEVTRKEKRIETERRLAERAEATLAKPDRQRSKAETEAAKATLAVAPSRIAVAEQDAADARAAYRAAGTPLEEADGGRRMPKVHKTKSRSYGHRLLRVNQAEGRKHFAG
jgi:hypothetical protein